MQNPSQPEGPSRRQVWRMFDRIAHRYDLLNRLLSFGRDVAWRKAMAQRLPLRDGLRVLDVATGTADVLLMLQAENARVAHGVGVDMSMEMLRHGRRKIMRQGLDEVLQLARGDGVRLPVSDASCDAATIAFGIRNVEDVRAGLSEMYRVLAPGGRALILEFSLPSNALFRWQYLFYFRHVLPRVGGAISGDAQAYRYLNQTVESFPYGDAFCDLMREAGFEGVEARPFTFGIATLYIGDRTA